MVLIHEANNVLFTIKAQYEPNNKVVFVYNEGLINAEQVEEVWRKIIEFSKNNSIIAVLNDGEKMKGTFTKINGFFKNEVIPKFEANGIKYVYNSLSSDVFTRFAMNSLLKMINTKIDIKVFSGAEEARKTLEKTMQTEVSYS